jgi:DNA-binding response OmpR family regulator
MRVLVIEGEAEVERLTSLGLTAQPFAVDTTREDGQVSNLFRFSAPVMLSSTKSPAKEYAILENLVPNPGACAFARHDRENVWLQSFDGIPGIVDV